MLSHSTHSHTVPVFASSLDLFVVDNKQVNRILSVLSQRKRKKQLFGLFTFYTLLVRFLILPSSPVSLPNMFVQSLDVRPAKHEHLECTC